MKRLQKLLLIVSELNETCGRRDEQLVDNMMARVEDENGEGRWSVQWRKRQGEFDEKKRLALEVSLAAESER